MAQVSLLIHIVFLEPYLFAHTIYGVGGASDKEPEFWPNSVAANRGLKIFKETINTQF